MSALKNSFSPRMFEAMSGGFRRLKEQIDTLSSGSIGQLQNTAKSMKTLADAVTKLGTGFSAMPDDVTAMSSKMYSLGEMVRQVGEAGNGVNTMQVQIVGQAMKEYANGVKSMTDILGSADFSRLNDPNLNVFLENLKTSSFQLGGMSRTGNTTGLRMFADDLNYFTQRMNGATQASMSSLPQSLMAMQSALLQLGASNPGPNLDAFGQSLERFATALTVINGANFESLNTVSNALSHFTSMMGKMAGVGNTQSIVDNIIDTLHDLNSLMDILSADTGNLSALQTVSTTLASFGKAMNSVGKVFASMGQINFDTMLSPMISGLRDLEESMERLMTDTDSFKNLEAATAKLRAFAEAIRELDKATKGKITPSLLQTAMQTREVGNASEQAASAVRRVGTASHHVNLLKLAFSGLALAVKPIGWLIKGVGSAVKVMTKPFTAAVGHVKNFFKNFLRMGKNMIFRNIMKFFMKGFKEGVDNLYLWSKATRRDNGGEFYQTMNSLSSTFATLKNTIGAAAGQLLEALAPALISLMNTAIRVINVFNQLVAVLSGESSWNRAKEITQQYTTSAKNANKATKDWLASFDELNVMPSDNGSGGGSGSSTNPANMFETVPLGDSISRLGDMIDDGSFYRLGLDIGNKIRNAVVNIDWRGIGRTLADGVNMALEFISGLVDSGVIEEAANNIGQSLGEFISGIEW